MNGKYTFTLSFEVFARKPKLLNYMYNMFDQPPSPHLIVQRSLQPNASNVPSLVPASPTPPHAQYNIQPPTLPNAQSMSEHLSQSHASIPSMTSLQPPLQPLVLRTSDLPPTQSMMSHEPLQADAQPVVVYVNIRGSNKGFYCGGQFVCSLIATPAT